MTQSYHLDIATLLMVGIILHVIAGSTISETVYVKVFYFVMPDWGPGNNGDQSCSDKNLKCSWEVSGDFVELTTCFDRFARRSSGNSGSNVTVTMYNIHSLWRSQKKHYPLNCLMRTDLSLATSEESMKHRSHSELFPKSFPNFDGYSTTSPLSSVQRIYKEAYLNETVVNFHTKNSMRPFDKLIKAGTYIASACHNSMGTESNRDKIVKTLRSSGFRVDGLGGCMKSKSPEGITLEMTENSEKNLELKREVIAKYLFNMAFENVQDPGYVTEKPWDALLAGTVPVYWGDSEQFKALLPDPKAAIFVSDYKGNIQKLAQYLTYLSNNETAYEEHRNWRKTFDSSRNSRENIQLRDSWECKVCNWAVEEKNRRKLETSADIKKRKSLIKQSDRCKKVP